MSVARDFARLFRIDGVGQVLAVVMENDDEWPCLQVRIPDADGCILTMNMKLADSDDYDKSEEIAYKMLGCFDEESARRAAAQLMGDLKAVIGAGQ